jgi:hypothetical protein
MLKARWPLLTALVAGFAALAASPLSEAAVFSAYNPAIHNRFVTGTTPNPTFLLSSYNLTGVGIDTPSTHGALLITPQHFIAANHFKSSTVSFLDASGATQNFSGVTYTAMTTTFDDGTGNMVTMDSDLVIGRLPSAIPGSMGISPLPIAIGDPSLFAGEQLFVFGQNNQAGRNLIDDIVLVAVSDGAGGIQLPTFTTAFDFDTPTNGGTGGVGDDEIGLVGGDSSYQTLMLIDGQLAAVGANFAVSGAPPSNYSNFSSFAAHYLDQIQALVGQDGHSVSTLTIPEPSSILLLGGATALLLLRRRCA